LTGICNLRRNVEERIAAEDAKASKLANIVRDFKAQSLSLRAMAAELNDLGIPAPRGGQWQGGKFNAFGTPGSCLNATLDLPYPFGNAFPDPGGYTPVAVGVEPM
jgi:hypothetical protein